MNRIEAAERTLSERAHHYELMGDAAAERACRALELCAHMAPIEDARAVHWYDRSGRCYEAAHRLWCRRFGEDPLTLRPWTRETVARLRYAASRLEARGSSLLYGWPCARNFAARGYACTRAAQRLRLRLMAAPRGWAEVEAGAERAREERGY